MKKITKALLVVLCGALCVCVLSACSEQQHVHHYLGSYSFDNMDHWLTCGCGDKFVLPHDFKEEVVTAPTETEKGQKRIYCSECGFEEFQDIPTTTHVHGFPEEYVYDGENHWKVCSCGLIDSKSAHVFVNWVTTEEPTEEKEGQKKSICEVCSYEVTQTIDKLPHVHAFEGEYKFSDNYHWQICACGEIGEKVKHEFDYSEKNASTHKEKCICGVERVSVHIFGSWQTETEATVLSEGVKKAFCVCGHAKSGVIPTLLQGNQSVEFYAINDFHGKTERISQFAWYLKNKKSSNPNAVFVNSGDMFQGSIESNFNYGRLLTDCMTEIGFDSFTFGNHEFDWGLDKLRSLVEYSSTPFLGANIYNWDPITREWGDFASDIAKEYVIVKLPNGVKVGIIGVIGKDQITSISSNLVQSIGFKNPHEIIPSLSQKLRDEEGCHVVAVSIHSGQSTLLNGIDMSLYADAVFCAHTHKAESTTKDGVPYIQGGSYGSCVSFVKLDVSNDNVVFSEMENIGYSSSWQSDSVTENIVNRYGEETNAAASQSITWTDSTLSNTSEMPRIACRAMAEYALSCGYDIVAALCNQARSNVFKGSVTFGDLYQALPFDNVVYIAEVSGENLKTVARSNYMWRVNPNAIQNGKIYKIAVIDYVLFHQNSDRKYDRLTSAFEEGRMKPVALTKDGNTYNYREMTRDFLLKSSAVEVSAYGAVTPRTSTIDLATDVTFNDDYIVSSQSTWVLIPARISYVRKQNLAA